MNKQTKLLTVTVALLGNLNLTAATTVASKPTGAFSSASTAKLLPNGHASTAANKQDGRNLLAKGRVTDQDGEPLWGLALCKKARKMLLSPI